MSDQELNRLDLVKKLIEQQVTQAKVAEKLDICIRQVQRLVKSYKDNNYQGLVSKKRGKPSNNKLPTQTKTEVLEIINKQYRDFGPTLALEKLGAHHGYKLSVERGLVEERPFLRFEFFVLSNFACSIYDNRFISAYIIYYQSFLF